MSDDDDMLFRRELRGEWKAPHIRESHPFPWRVRETTTPSPASRDGNYRVWIVLDDRGKCVAECDEPDAAHSIVNTMNAVNGPPAASETQERK